jgi:hypothetical protein
MFHVPDPGRWEKRPKLIRASNPVQQRAKELRQTMTPAERVLWEHLLGCQHPIGTCIVDFYCAEARLVTKWMAASTWDRSKPTPIAARNW